VLMKSPTFMVIIPADWRHRRAGLEPRPGAGHIVGMNKRRPPELDMTIEGEFVSPPRAPVTSRILMWAVVIAILAGALSLAAFALWLALLILPVAVGAAIVAWAILRYRLWRAQRTVGQQRGVWHP
jgi:hypothetical protein